MRKLATCETELSPTQMLILGGYNGADYFSDTSSYTPGKTMYLYLKP